MPLLGTRGAASVRGFGFGANLAGANGFLQTVDSGAYGTNTLGITYDTDNNAYVGLYITSSYSSGYTVLMKLAAGTGTVLWKFTLDTAPVIQNSATLSLAFANGYLYIYRSASGELTKISPSGTVIEARQLSYSIQLYASGQSCNQLEIDGSGNIYIGGPSYDSSYTYVGYAITKLNSSYVVQWSKVYYRTAGTYNANHSTIRLGLDGNISFTYYYSDGTTYYVEFQTVSSSNGLLTSSCRTATINAAAFTGDKVTDSSGNTYNVLPASGTGNTYIFKTDNIGALLWSKQIPYGVDSYASVAVDNSGNSYYLLGGSNTRLLKFNGSGSLLWAKNMAGAFGNTTAQGKLSINAGLLFGAVSPFIGDYGTSFALPSNNGPANGTYTSKSIVISTVTPTITTPTTLNLFTNVLTTINQTTTVSNTTVTLYSYTLPATSNATVLSA